MFAANQSLLAGPASFYHQGPDEQGTQAKRAHRDAFIIENCENEGKQEHRHHRPPFLVYGYIVQRKTIRVYVYSRT